MPYKDQRIFQALKDRLEAISTDGAYETNAGLSVHIGRVDLNDDDALGQGVICIAPGETQTPAQGLEALRLLPITLEGLIRMSEDDPLLPAIQLLGDMKRAIFSPDLDPTLGGLLEADDPLVWGGQRYMEREPGSRVVGVQLDLTARYVETVGRPDEALA